MFMSCLYIYIFLFYEVRTILYVKERNIGLRIYELYVSHLDFIMIWYVKERNVGIYGLYVSHLDEFIMIWYVKERNISIYELHIKYFSAS